MEEDNAIEQLRTAVEQKVGRAMRTPKDFDFLHSCIFDECHTMISTSTLKRIWGYVQTESEPRLSSLNLLARFVDYNDWDSFVTAHGGEIRVQKKRHWIVIAAAALLCVSIGIGFWLSRPSTVTPVTIAKKGRVLHKGSDSFRSIEDYLTLFGIEPGDTNYFRPLPGLDYVYVWGPEYGHPVWHNEGDTLQLLPTITEYWTPLPGTTDYQSEEYVKLANEKLYYERLNVDELRITFMRDIVPGFYIFLGIYRMDRERSTKEKFVWRRVADECDLGRLADLERLREISR